MEREQFDAVMGRIAARLEELGLSERKASIAASGKPDMIRDMKRRGTLPTTQPFRALAAVLGTTADWLIDGGEAPTVLTEVRGTGLVDKELESAWRGEPAAKPVPLLGSAIGGEWDGIAEAIELTELHLADVLDYVARPPSVSGDPAAYAVTIVGDSMAPRFEPGERAYVSPRAPAAIGDDVIVQLCNGGDGEEADRIVMVLIKRLVRRTARELELRQFNPDTSFRIPLTKVKAVHKVVGRM